VRERLFGVHASRESKIGDDRRAVAIDENVARLYVAVNQPSLVREVQRVRDGRDESSDVSRPMKEEIAGFTSFQALRQRPAAYKLHRYVGTPVEDSEVVDLANAAMI
jgi:hypothetical protein